MNNEKLLLIKNETHTIIEHTALKPQGRLDFKKNIQMETLSFSPRINLADDGELVLAMTVFETANSVFKTINKNNSFLIDIPSHWNSGGAGELINKLNNFLELRSGNVSNYM